jgi:hypothetical protein
MRQQIIIDESIFVIAHRSNSSMHSQLMMFLEQSQKNDPDRKYDLHLTSISKKRLAMFRWFQIRCFIKCFFYDAVKKEAAKKRGWRIRIARQLVRSIKRRSLRETLFKSKLMDIFMYVNEAKSKFLEEKENRRIVPEEIIPLELCSIAQIAHRTGIPILSFNTDYRFFCHLPLSPKTYITYLYPEIFLAHTVRHS